MNIDMNMEAHTHDQQDVPPRMTGHVAVLADSASLRSLVFRIIEGRGWTPVEIDVADLDRPDPVDWDMLVIGATKDTMNPVHVCAAASRHWNLRVLVTSPHRDAQTIADILNAGADDYLVAPFDPLELDARMQVLFSRNIPRQAFD